MVAEVTLELIQHGYFNAEELGLRQEDKFHDSSWTTTPVSAIYKNHFAAFFDDVLISAVKDDADEADDQRAFDRRKHLRKGIPELFKTSSTETCDLRVIMVLEVLLSMARFDGEI